MGNLLNILKYLYDTQRNVKYPMQIFRNCPQKLFTNKIEI